MIMASLGCSASASAANAAALAALMIDASQVGEDEIFVNTRGIAPKAIGNILGNNALDMDNPYTEGFDKDFEFASGKGFISALDAIAAVPDGHEHARIAKSFKGTESIEVSEVRLDQQTVVSLFPSRSSSYTNHMGLLQNEASQFF